MTAYRSVKHYCDWKGCGLPLRMLDPTSGECLVHGERHVGMVFDTPVKNGPRMHDYDEMPEERFARAACRNGHEYTNQTTKWYVAANGEKHRICLICHEAGRQRQLARDREKRAKLRAADGRGLHIVKYEAPEPITQDDIASAMEAAR